eukprot:scaffold896_cov172-Amphora_coffeaeformis.AAC.20
MPVSVRSPSSSHFFVGEKSSKISIGAMVVVEEALGCAKEGSDEMGGDDVGDTVAVLGYWSL